MIITLLKKPLVIKFVLRHRFEDNKGDITKEIHWHNWSIGTWFKSYKAVAKGGLKKVYLCGVDFLIVKMWFDIHSPKIIEIEVE